MPDVPLKRVLVASSLMAIAYFAVRVPLRGSPYRTEFRASRIPLLLGPWHGADDPVDTAMIQAAGVDAFLNRHYISNGEQVDLYIGYNADQRAGQVIHSPANCLPGAGWEIARHANLENLGRGLPEELQEYWIQKDSDKKLVLYWYHGRGRDYGNEYTAKLWLFYDSLIRNRTDGALVRVLTAAGDSDSDALPRSLRFIRVFLPYLTGLDS